MPDPMYCKYGPPSGFLSNFSIIGNIPPKDVSFSDFICIFAMPDEVLFDYYSNTKLSEFSDMAKSLATFCCSGFYKRENLQCCGIKVNLTNTIGELLNN